MTASQALRRLRNGETIYVGPKGVAAISAAIEIAGGTWEIDAQLQDGQWKLTPIKAPTGAE